MINAKELRIGNCVINNGTGEVITIGAYDILNAYDDNHRHSPIELTPEILEKAGFQKEEDFDTWYLGFFQMVLDEDGSFFSCYLPNAIHIKTVHHLQNLYYALTGTELEINLQ